MPRDFSKYSFRPEMTSVVSEAARDAGRDDCEDAYESRMASTDGVRGRGINWRNSGKGTRESQPSSSDEQIMCMQCRMHGH